VPKSESHCDMGLDERCRDKNGEIRHKRGDTLLKTLRKAWGAAFVRAVRADSRLETLRERAGGASSLSEFVKSGNRRRQ
jgi:hypothetical protein